VIKRNRPIARHAARRSLGSGVMGSKMPNEASPQPAPLP
jgi:hypothetical protein